MNAIALWLWCVATTAIYVIAIHLGLLCGRYFDGRNRTLPWVILVRDEWPLLCDGLHLGLLRCAVCDRYCDRPNRTLPWVIVLREAWALL